MHVGFLIHFFFLSMYLGTSAQDICYSIQYSIFSRFYRFFTWCERFIYFSVNQPIDFMNEASQQFMYANSKLYVVCTYINKKNVKYTIKHNQRQILLNWIYIYTFADETIKWEMQKNPKNKIWNWIFKNKTKKKKRMYNVQNDKQCPGA